MTDQPLTAQDKLGQADRVVVPLAVRRQADIYQQACWIAARHLIEVQGLDIDPHTIGAEMRTQYVVGVAGWIRGLADLGLLRHVGVSEVPGKRKPRDLYTIPYEHILDASITLAKAELAASRRRYLISAAPDPAQLQLDLDHLPPLAVPTTTPFADIPFAAVQDMLNRLAQADMPLLVRRRVGIPEQICWLSMSALIDRGVAAFGVRDIALEMPTRAYPRVIGWVQSLIDAGLVGVVGTEKVPNCADRRVFAIPWEFILRESMALAKRELEVSGRRYQRVGPVPAEIARELGLPPSVIHPHAEHEDGSREAPPSVIHPHAEHEDGSREAPPSVIHPHAEHEDGSQETPPSVIHPHVQHEDGSRETPPAALQAADNLPPQPFGGPPSVIHPHVQHENGSQEPPFSVIYPHVQHEDGSQETPSSVIYPHVQHEDGSQNGPFSDVNGANRDMILSRPVIYPHAEHEDRSRVGGWVGEWVSGWEGESDRARALFDAAPPPPPGPSIFAAHPGWVWRGELYAHPLDIWQCVAEAPRYSDIYALASLASQHNTTTDGTGWYWIGHAMQMVAAQGKKIRAPQLVVVMMAVWCKSDTYGADGEDYRAKAEGRSPAKGAPEQKAARPALAGADGAPSPLEPNSPAPLDPSSEAQAGGAAHLSHPAVMAYIAAFDLRPNVKQIERIAATVTDLDVWGRVLADWQVNGWKAGSVAKQLDRYAKEAAPAVVIDAAAFEMLLYTHPDLDAGDLRSRWLRRWHRASPDEKPALIVQFAKEHPDD